MNCTHWTAYSHGGRCGLLETTVSRGVCRHCLKRQPVANYTEPSPAEQAVITPTPPDPGTWPRLARWVSTLARPEDQGVGDTVARLISPLGSGEIAARWPRLAGLAGRVIVRLLGDDMDTAWVRLGGGGCQCASRQAGLNLRYPYPRVG